MIKPNKDNCLAALRPDLVKEWDYEKNYPLTPFDIAPYSNKKVWWKCKCGHSYDATVANKSKGNNCPYCCQRKICIDNCLATLRPDLAKEWHPTKNGKLTPWDVVCGSDQRVWWECEKHHEWFATILSRACGARCPYCSGNKVCIDTCLATLNPELAKEWDYDKNYPLTPSDVFSQSNKKRHWKCKNGHVWLATVNNRNHKGSCCPDCNKVILIDGTFWDSLVEAYYYLKLKSKKVKFEHHVKIGLGRCICDFYIPSTNTYVEVTGYDKNWNRWKTYRKGIIRKKNRITKTLGANFEFIKIKLTPQQIRYVRKNIEHKVV